MPEQPPTICPHCQSPINHIPAGVSKRTGKRYGEFWACANRDCNFTWRPKKEKKVNSSVLILDELQEFRKEFNERMNKLAKFLMEKLEK